MPDNSMTLNAGNSQGGRIETLRRLQRERTIRLAQQALAKAEPSIEEQ